MGRKSNLGNEERVEVVLALLRGEEKLEVLARRHGICANTLRRYRDEFIAGGRAQLMGKSSTQALESETKALKRQIEERDMVIGEYTIANRFLKKRADRMGD